YTNLPREPLYRFDIVRDDFRSGLDDPDDIHGLRLEIRDQGLQCRIGIERFDRADGILPDDAAPVLELVTVDRGDPRMLDLHEIDGFGYPLRLIPIHRVGTARRDGAEPAAPGA